MCSLRDRKDHYCWTKSELRRFNLSAFLPVQESLGSCQGTPHLRTHNPMNILSHPHQQSSYLIRPCMRAGTDRGRAERLAADCLLCVCVCRPLSLSVNPHVRLRRQWGGGGNAQQWVDGDTCWLHV